MQRMSGAQLICISMSSFACSAMQLCTTYMYDGRDWLRMAAKLSIEILRSEVKGTGHCEQVAS